MSGLSKSSECSYPGKKGGKQETKHWHRRNDRAESSSCIPVSLPPKPRGTRLHRVSAHGPALPQQHSAAGSSVLRVSWGWKCFYVQMSSKVNVLLIFFCEIRKAAIICRWTSVTLSYIPRFRPSLSGRGLVFLFKMCISNFSPVRVLGTLTRAILTRFRLGFGLPHCKTRFLLHSSRQISMFLNHHLYASIIFL